jgi:hypothetical protein
MERSIHWDGFAYGSHGKQAVSRDLGFADGSVLEATDGIHWEEKESLCDANICGTLLLASGKTYGRSKLRNKRLLYGFRPADRSLPMFAVPYHDGGKSFVKARTDRYGIITFVECRGERPEGILSEIIGDVGDPCIYDEYQLVKNGLRHSSRAFRQFLRSVRDSPQWTASIEMPGVEPVTAFTIDPEGCKDFDDAFTVARDGAGWIVNVHIADVCTLIDTFGAWKWLGGCSQSVYLDTGVRGMLPGTLSEDKLSLVQGMPRRVVTTTFKISASGDMRLDNISKGVCIVDSNWVYGDHALVDYAGYTGLRQAAEVVAGHDISDSHDVVAWWMVRLNVEAGRILGAERTGVFRVCSAVMDPRTNILHQLGLAKVADWDSAYSLWGHDLEHRALGCTYYAQVSSPIRRLCDIVNQALLLGLVGHASDGSRAFCEGMMNVDVVHRMTGQGCGARRAERASKFAGLCTRFAGSLDLLDAVCVRCGEPNYRGVRRLEFYVRSLEACVHSVSMRMYVPGDSAKLRLHQCDAPGSQGREFVVDIVLD